MALVLIQAPASEPLGVADAKTFLRVDTTTEDALIGSLIITSRLHIEAAFDMALIAQSWRLLLDRWPRDRGVRRWHDEREPPVVKLPLWPVSAISDVIVTDMNGVPQALVPASYVSDVAGRPARIAPSRGAIWPEPGPPLSGIAIDFTAGFGPNPGDVPAPIRQALLLLTAHWYEHRDPIEIGAAGTQIPTPISDLLEPYRQRRL